MRETDVAVVGAGPAGLAVAAAVADAGGAATLLDDNALPGGQYFRRLPPGFRHTAAGPFDKDRARAEALYRVTAQAGVSYLPGAVVWEAPAPGVLAFARGAETGRIRARIIVLAPGAADQPVPFPGWTLPGVITAGGLQNLIKGARVIPGRRVVVAGNGPLVLLTAANLARAGAEVVACETAPLGRRLWRALPKLAAAPEIVRQAADHRGALIRAGAPFHTGWTVIEAAGEETLETVTLAPIDGAGRIARDRAATLAADTLVVGFGLAPSTELCRLMGCALHYRPLRGGWLPVRGAAFETTVPGVHAVGDGAGIGGVEIALAEGRLMGLHATERLGRLDGDESARLRRPIARRLHRFARFRDGLERLYAPPASMRALITPETVVCRCEEVTAAEVAARLAEGLTSAAAIKGSTRMSMGRCQGRNCLATLAMLVGEGAVEAVPLPHARPPARSITIGELMHEPLEAPTLPEDPHLPRGEEAV